MKRRDHDGQVPDMFKGEPRLKARPDITERILKRIEEEEGLARGRRRAILVAVAVLVAIVLAVWRTG